MLSDVSTIFACKLRRGDVDVAVFVHRKIFLLPIGGCNFYDLLFRHRDKSSESFLVVLSEKKGMQEGERVRQSKTLLVRDVC